MTGAQVCTVSLLLVFVFSLHLIKKDMKNENITFEQHWTIMRISNLMFFFSSTPLFFIFLHFIIKNWNTVIL